MRNFIFRGGNRSAQRWIGTQVHTSLNRRAIRSWPFANLASLLRALTSEEGIDRNSGSLLTCASYRSRGLQILVVTLLMVVAGAMQAQVNMGAISGSVTDSTGGLVSGATVAITNQGTGVSTNLTTDSRGFYSAEGLPVGQYKIDVSKPGFQETLTQGIQIDPGQRRANNVVLQVGTTTTNLTVTANAQQVNTETSESGGTLNSKQINNLMLNGRNFQTLAIAIPGVSSAVGADSQTVTQNTYLIVNGNAAETTTQTIDGVYNMASGNLTEINIRPIVDGISEFSVLKDNYSAKYGFAGSGQVIVETKSGTDTFHGSAWDYLRNNALDANNYFTTAPQPLRQNIYGYTLGGPLVIPKLYNTDRSKRLSSSHRTSGTRSPPDRSPEARFCPRRFAMETSAKVPR
jgi:hypothetical protein